MRGVTPENYQKVRHVSKFNEETIFEPLKVEKDRQTELCGIIPQEIELRFFTYKWVHESQKSTVAALDNQYLYAYILKWTNKNDFRPPKNLDYTPRTNTCSFDGMIGDKQVAIWCVRYHTAPCHFKGVRISTLHKGMLNSKIRRHEVAPWAWKTAGF